MPLKIADGQLIRNICLMARNAQPLAKLAERTVAVCLKVGS